MDPRLALFVGGLVIFLVSFFVPDNLDQVKKLTQTLQDLNDQSALCKDIQCQNSINIMITDTRLALDTAEVPGQIKAAFFIGGIISEVAFAISLKF